MDLCNQSCLSGQPLSVRSFLSRGNNFNVGHYALTFQPNSFIPAVLIGTLDLCHLLPFQ